MTREVNITLEYPEAYVAISALEFYAVRLSQAPTGTELRVLPKSAMSAAEKIRDAIAEDFRAKEGRNA